MAADNKTASLGKYRNLEKVGEGGFGVVYKARDPGLDRTVAVKVLKGELSGSADALERFHREARMAASLRHPNIVTVLEVGEEAGRYFIVMDYLPGPTLAEKLKEGRLALWEVVRLLKPLAAALDYAHAQSVVHRDVKPANILLNAQGEPVLTDFGLVKSLADAGVTTTGVTLGTAYYMAPEQIRNQEVAAYTDQYSLGVLVFEMLSGRVPFEGKSPFDVQLGHVQKEAPDMIELNPALPGEVRGVFQTVLAKEGAGRFASCTAFAAVLDGIATAFGKEQVKAWFENARAALDGADFDAALGYLNQADEIYLSEESQKLRGQIQHRKEVRERFEEAQTELVTLLTEEPWLFEHVLPLAEVFETFHGKQAHRRADNAVVETKSKDENIVEKPRENAKKPQGQRAEMLEAPAETQGGDRLTTDQKTAPAVLANPAGIEWVEIPAGDFLYGEKKEKHRIEKPYRIGKYPVTNAQYQKFINANPDYKVPSHWNKRKRTYPDGKGSHPVVDVSWHDAQAFCQWNGCRLPTEEEWEKAARGTDGRTYPWGEDWMRGKYCNNEEAGIGNTTPVDKYPEGVSPYGVWDMSGNVWEWTASQFGGSSYVLRGGSWIFNGSSVRSAYRFWYHPVSSLSGNGFRCALSPSF